MHTLDAFDRRVLTALQEDASQTAAALARLVGLSQAACWRRVQRLKAEGYIAAEVALLDRKRLGWGVELFVHVKLNAHGRANVADFTDAVCAHPQVLECHIVLGSVDALLRVVARDVDDYQRFFFEHLSRAPGVEQANSMTILAQIKSTSAVPV